MQLWLESLFRSRDYLLCVVHFKSSNTQRSISKGRNENTSAAEILGFQLRNLSRSIGKRIWPDFSHSTDELVILAEGQIEIEVTGVILRPVIGEEIFISAQALSIQKISRSAINFGTVRMFPRLLWIPSSLVISHFTQHPVVKFWIGISGGP